MGVDVLAYLSDQQREDLELGRRLRENPIPIGPSGNVVCSICNGKLSVDSHGGGYCPKCNPEGLYQGVKTTLNPIPGTVELISLREHTLCLPCSGCGAELRVAVPEGFVTAQIQKILQSVGWIIVKNGSYRVAYYCAFCCALQHGLTEWE